MRLSVNIDHIATLRQARRAVDPDPVAGAILAELAGADGITVHLRADRRHIQERDLYLLRETVRTRLNVEVGMTPEALKIMREVHPDQVTLVPESAGELTTEGGLDLSEQRAETEEYLALYREAEIEVSLFINPDLETVKLAGKIGSTFVELNTASYGAASDEPGRLEELRRISDAAKLAARLKMEVHAGHDITYRNVSQFLVVKEVGEVSIGHAIVARAALVGMERAVREMISALAGEGKGRG